MKLILQSYGIARINVFRRQIMVLSCHSCGLKRQTINRTTVLILHSYGLKRLTRNRTTVLTLHQYGLKRLMRNRTTVLTLHSYGLKRLTRNRTIETPTQAKRIHSQISWDSGDMKLNTPGFCFTGRLIMIEIPWVMKGFVKSITFSRDEVIVRGAMAISASCSQNNARHVMKCFKIL